MTKRGRPSNKTLHKRKVAKQKSKLYVVIAILVILVIVAIAMFSNS